MKTLRNKKDLELAEQLEQLIGQRRELEKTEKRLKEHFKRMELDAIKVGSILITFTEAERTSLDKKSLIEKYGEETIKEYEKTTAYKKIDVKRVS